MAVRDRNLFAWQAYVITMSIVSVALLAVMFFLWRSYSDLSTRLADAQTARQNATTEFQTSDKRVDRLLSMMGYSDFTEADLQQMAEEFKADAKLGQVEVDFAEAMKLFPPNQPANEKNLIGLPKFLIDTIRIRNGQIDSARDRETQLQTELAATVDRETKAREDAVNKQKAAEADLAKARQDHTTEITRLNTEKDEAVAMFGKYKASMDQKLAKFSSENTDLKRTVATLEETIQVKNDIINQFREPDFAAPQGSVVRVANGGTRLWINLGSADGLRQGVPFSVIDENEVNISKAKPKAKVVVIRVVEKHLAYAELTQQINYKNPVVPGDKIYSPAWRPGRKVGFALVGKMDMNGDRKDDIEQVRELIKLSGGVVDAEMDVNTQQTGKLSHETTFLVMGTDLTVPENANPDLLAQQQARLKDYAGFIAEARQNGIIQISLDKLMGYLKTEGSDRAVPLGNRIQGKDFAAKAQNSPPVSRGKVSDVYTPRKQP